MIRGEISLLISSDSDIISARQKARRFAEQIGFNGSWPFVFSTIISQLARSMLNQSKPSRINIKSVYNGIKPGIEVQAANNDSEIIDSTASTVKGIVYKKSTDFKTLVKNHIIDEFNVTPVKGQGINVSIVKWL